VAPHAPINHPWAKEAGLEASKLELYFVGTKQWFWKSNKDLFLLDLHFFYSVSIFHISFFHLFLLLF
jgi:hypothetical protein